VELLDPEIEYVNPAGAIEPGTRRGLQEFIAATERLSEGWASWKMEPEQLIDAGDKVAVVMSYRARARRSGLEVEGRESALLTVAGGRIVRYEWFHEPNDALVAAGLADELPQNHVELVLRQADATNRRDLDGFLACVAEDVEWEETAAGFPGLRAVYHGRSELREWFTEVVLGVWEDVHFEREEIARLEGGQVLIGGVLSARGQLSGVETQLRFWQLFSFATGLITRRQVFLGSREEALAAAAASV
jgi:ketosteroid isomerase-like protein